MREPTTVDLRVGTDGTLVVLAFTWRDQLLQVVGVGRHWQADDGGHWLVMTPVSRVFELLQAPDGHWFVVRASNARCLV